MGDTKAHPLAEEAPCDNGWFKPESGPAIKELEKNRESEGAHLNWDSNPHKRGK